MATATASILVGLDEAGAGPAFGSLWAAAVHIPEDSSAASLVADSKTIKSEAKRLRLREVIVRECPYGLGEVTQAEIDLGGLGEARRLVFERALDDYVAKEGQPFPTQLIVDGTLFRPWRHVPYECRPKADATEPSVSAASILAKTSRDTQVLSWCDADPSLDLKYGIRSNKGYLSSKHIAGLKEHGWSALHRRSYQIRGL